VGSVSSVETTVKESGADGVLLVGDKAFYSATNMEELVSAGP
jgi:transposase